MAVLWRHCFTPAFLRPWLLVVFVDYCRYCQVGEGRKTPEKVGVRPPVARIEVLVVMLLIGLAFSNASCAPKQSRSREPGPNPNPRAKAASECSTYIYRPAPMQVRVWMSFSKVCNWKILHTRKSISAAESQLKCERMCERWPGAQWVNCKPQLCFN